jgi:nitrous oxidase accessory protein NosD
MSMALQRSPVYRALRLFQPCGISPLVVGLACLLVSAPLLATELLVPETYATIQAALDVAVNGDVVSVAPRASPHGYQENVRFTSHGVTLRSRTGQGVRHGATIQGDGTEHVVTFNAYSGTVEGFVITGAGSPHSGVFTSQAEQVIRGNLITGNASHGITISSNSVATIEANLIVDNQLSPLSAGIRVMTGASGVIVNNYVSGSGVGIYASPASGGLNIINNTFVDNPSYGMVFSDDARMNIRNNIITGSDYGIYFSGAYAPDISSYVGQFLTIDHNVLWDNIESNYYAWLSGGDPVGLNEGPFSPLPGTSEIYADPLLDPKSGYELLDGSPAIDAGDNATCPATDQRGVARPIDGDDPPDGFADCDIGAVEYLPEPRASAMLIAGAVFLGLLYQRR